MLHKISQNPIVEASLENIEAVADLVIDNDILRSIPVVGTLLKVIRGTADIRDRLFAAKLLTFLKSIGAVSASAKEKIRERVAESPEEARKVGETLVLLLDRLADIDKTEIIAKVFLAYAYGYIKSGDFQRVAHAIDQAILSDLQILLTSYSHDTGKRPPSSEPFMQALYPSGLTKMVAGKTIETLGQFFFEVSPTGNRLINAYLQGCKLAQPEKGKRESLSEDHRDTSRTEKGRKRTKTNRSGS